MFDLYAYSTVKLVIIEQSRFKKMPFFLPTNSF